MLVILKDGHEFILHNVLTPEYYFANNRLKISLRLGWG